MTSIKLKKLEAAHFRGFRDKQTIEFSDKITLIYGANATGKSSIVNAIEWCLYGSEIAKKGWGEGVEIEEREGWEVANVFSKMEPEVTITFDKDGKEIQLSRLGEKGELKCEEEISFLSDLTPSNFMHSHYLHQELIRDIVILSKSKRKELLSFFLGVGEYSELRNVINDLITSNKKTSLKKIIDEKSESKEKTIDITITGIFKIEKELEGRLEKRGVDKLSVPIKDSEELLLEVKKITDEIEDNFEIKVEEFETPKIQNADDIKKVGSYIQDRIQIVVSQFTGVKDRKALLEKKSEYEELLVKAEDLEKSISSHKEKLTKIPDNANLEKLISELDNEIKYLEIERDRLGSLVSIIKMAIKYLENLISKNELETECPVCSKPKLDVRDRLAKLKEIDLDKLDEEGNIINNTISDKDKILSEYIYIKKESDELNSKKLRIYKEIESIIEKKIDDGTNIATVLENKIDEFKSIIEEMSKREADFGKKINEIKELCEKFSLYKEMQELNELKEKLKEPEELTEFKEFDNSLRIASNLLKNLSILEDLLADLEKEKIEENIKPARTRINDYYNMATYQRKDFTSINILEDGSLELIKANGAKNTESLMSVLNMADMSIASLAIFLGLNVSRTSDERFSFLILDEPTQNIFGNRVDGIAKIICHIVAEKMSNNKQLVITMADDLFFDKLESSLITKPKIIHLETWNYETGIRIKRT